MRLLVTRPNEDAQHLGERLAAMGHQMVAAPLLEIKYIAGDALDFDGVQAIVFTSANGVRAFAQRSTERSFPALCVGDATGREARTAGFADVKSAAGDVDALAALVRGELKPDGGAVLHPAGSKVAGDLAGQLQAAGFTYRREVLYQAHKATALPDGAREALQAGTVGGVLLYSPRTAAAFVVLVRAGGYGDALAGMTAYCLSPAVAREVQGLSWAAVRVASHPDEDALLALLQ